MLADLQIAGLGMWREVQHRIDHREELKFRKIPTPNKLINFSSRLNFFANKASARVGVNVPVIMNGGLLPAKLRREGWQTVREVGVSIVAGDCATTNEPNRTVAEMND
jgi:hypothetical protein